MTKSKQSALDDLKELEKESSYQYLKPETYKTIRAALSEPQWQTIDSAPMDGTEIIVYCPYTGVVTAKYQDRRHREWVCTANGGDLAVKYMSDFDTEYHDDLQPTHWKLLPSPPVKTANGPEEDTEYRAAKAWKTRHTQTDSIVMKRDEVERMRVFLDEIRKSGFISYKGLRSCELAVSALSILSKALGGGG